jgi:Flp pilus assembly protein TadD
LYDQGRARLALGDFAAATELIERALTLFQEVNFRHGEALAVYQRGRILLSAGARAARSRPWRRPWRSTVR